ncbi:MAG TPA: pseudouridine synthase [Candidatus Omnitrophota bacterium]|nr:pseudouridine synthase [Candidatus Omnitrophota bacterium]HRK60938.1 pseudouridine synthase [Candidatus Omnitrophota bacterium]
MIIVFNKPYGVLSQFTPDQPGQKVLAEFAFPQNVYPVGRLDLDSEGLLILSDEKVWNDKLLNPEHAHERTYHVQVEGKVTRDAAIRLEKGVVIQGYKTKPCKALRLDSAPEYPPRIPPIRERKNIPTSWMELKLIEGKNRQVRRMTAAVGFPTLRLIRAAIGKIRLEGLAEGQWREIKAEELC